MSSVGLFILHSQIMRSLSGRFEPSLRVCLRGIYHYLIGTLDFFFVYSFLSLIEHFLRESS